MNIVKPLPAATLVLVRDYEGELQVFLQKRSEQASFVGGAYVFPGGKVEASDFEFPDELMVLPEGQFKTKLLGQTGGLAAIIAAIRECFEEAGVLLAYDQFDALIAIDNKQSQSHFSSLKDRLYQGDISLVDICQQENLRLAIDQFAYLAQWITPQGSSQRFDTQFFACLMPAFQQGGHDGYESVDSVWLSPEDFLDRNKSGEINLIYPTLKTLEELLDHNSAQDYINHHHRSVPVLGD